MASSLFKVGIVTPFKRPLRFLWITRDPGSRIASEVRRTLLELKDENDI